MIKTATTKKARRFERVNAVIDISIGTIAIFVCQLLVFIHFFKWNKTKPSQQHEEKIVLHICKTKQGTNKLPIRVFLSRFTRD